MKQCLLNIMGVLLVFAFVCLEFWLTVQTVEHSHMWGVVIAAVLLAVVIGVCNSINNGDFGDF